MARRFLQLCTAGALVFAGWKAKGKVDDVFDMPKPASVLGKLSQFWDGIYSGGSAAKKQTQQVEASIRQEVDPMKAELRKMREGQRQIIAALEEMRSRDARHEDYQRDGNY